MVSTHLKNNSQLGPFPQIGDENKKYLKQLPIVRTPKNMALNMGNSGLFGPTLVSDIDPLAQNRSYSGEG